MSCSLELSDNKIRELFQLITLRAITHHTLSVGRAIAKSSQQTLIGVLKDGMLPVRTREFYLVRADVMDRIFRELNVVPDVKEIKDLSELQNTD